MTVDLRFTKNIRLDPVGSIGFGSNKIEVQFGSTQLELATNMSENSARQTD